MKTERELIKLAQSKPDAARIARQLDKPVLAVLKVARRLGINLAAPPPPPDRRFKNTARPNPKTAAERRRAPKSTMKNVTARPYTDPEIAARKLVEIANGIEAVQDGRIYRAAELPDAV